MEEDRLRSHTGRRSLVLTHPAQQRGEDLQIFGLLSVEKDEGTQQEREGGLRGGTDSRD